MKRTYFFHFFIVILFFLSIPHSLTSHGFWDETIVSTCYVHQEHIHNIRKNFEKNNKYEVLSRSSTGKYEKKTIAFSCTWNCQLFYSHRFDQHCAHNICCSPVQEFFVPNQKKWIPAFELKVGDVLLTKYLAVISINSVQFVECKMPITILEVKDNHTFFVGHYGVLTHNIPLLAVTAGISIPFEVGALFGGSVGSVFGQPMIIGGVVLGGLISWTITKLTSSKKSVEMSFNFDAAQLQNAIYMSSLIFLANEVREKLKMIEIKNCMIQKITLLDQIIRMIQTLQEMGGVLMILAILVIMLTIIIRALVILIIILTKIILPRGNCLQYL